MTTPNAFAPPLEMGAPALQLVREELNCVASREVVREIMDEALRSARRSSVPPESDQVRVFVEFHLWAAASRVLGRDDAEELVRRLRMMILR